jgi:hypothetical protein
LNMCTRVQEKYASTLIQSVFPTECSLRTVQMNSESEWLLPVVHKVACQRDCLYLDLHNKWCLNFLPLSHPMQITTLPCTGKI